MQTKERIIGRILAAKIREAFAASQGRMPLAPTWGFKQFCKADLQGKTAFALTTVEGFSDS